MATLMVCVFVLTLFNVQIMYGADNAIAVDGVKDAQWEAMGVLGTSENPGHNGFSIGNLYMTNDEQYLYYYVDNLVVDNWGDNGMYMDMAFNVNGVDSGDSSNPWNSQFNYEGMANKPTHHMIHRIKNDNETNWFSFVTVGTGEVYNAGNVDVAGLGSQHFVDRTTGFEGKIPLAFFGVENGSTIEVNVVLTGNNEAEHGAFDVIPEVGNTVADSWNEFDEPNVQSVYSTPYIISGMPETTGNPVPAFISPSFEDDGTVVLTAVSSEATHFVAGNLNGWSFEAMDFVDTYQEGDDDVNLFTYTLSSEQISNNGGHIEYKLNPDDSWSGNQYQDPNNLTPLSGDNSTVEYLRLDAQNAQVEKGRTLQVRGLRTLSNSSVIDLDGLVFSLSGNTDVTIDATGLITCPDDAVDESFDVTLTYDIDGSHSITLTQTISVVESLVSSPVVEGDKVTFNYVGDSDAQSVHVPGAFNGWNPDADQMSNTESLYTLDTTLSPGVYEYKFHVDGNWMTDPLNTSERNGNSYVVVPGVLVTAPDGIKPGESKTLSAEFLEADESVTSISTEFSIVEGGRDGITISALGELNVAASVEPVIGDSLTVRASYTKDGITYTTDAIINLVAETTRFKIHYFRYDGNYDNWDLWLWLDNQDGVASSFSEVDVNGYMTGTFDYAGDVDQLNFIVRYDNWADREPGGNRVVTATDGLGEAWLIQGDENVYSAYSEDLTNAQILSAIADQSNQVKLNLTHVLPTIDYTDFVLMNGNDVISGSSVMGSSDTEVVITTDEAIDVTLDLQAVYQGGSYRPKDVLMREILNQFVYTGDDLGLNYSVGSSTFKVWAPTATNVSLALYNSVELAEYNSAGYIEDHTGYDRLETMTKTSSGVWMATINEDLEGMYYMYQVSFDDGRVNYALDPYAYAASGNGGRTAIVDLDQHNPSDWSEDKPNTIQDFTDAVIYELHVRDFSIDDNSGMSNKGKYLAFTEEGTSYNGESTGVDHLSELGVTHVHLLPVYDIRSVNELTVDDPSSDDPKFNWGYDPQNYNVPEGSYSTDPMDPTSRIIEFKEMVQSLHNQDIRVVMDVVYNHTASVEDGPFDLIVPGYYYRTNDLGALTNGSGCGNEVASERPMIRKYIVDSVNFWAKEYNVDGFRFDLMGLIDVTTMEQVTSSLKAYDSTIEIYGEPWQAGGSPLASNLQTTKGQQQGLDFAVFNDDIRGAIKGDSDSSGNGFATGGLGFEGDIVTGIWGATGSFASDPEETINYVTAHDNLVLWDKIIRTQSVINTTIEEDEGFIHLQDGVLSGESASHFNSVEEAVAAATTHHDVNINQVFDNETVRRDVLANGIVLTAQGVPFIHAGSEILRSKYGDHNSYKSPDAINQILWEDKVNFNPVFDYYAGLIELRKAHPAFRLDDTADLVSHLSVMNQADNLVSFKLGEYAAGDSWKNIVVIYNANQETKSVSLPSDTTWNVVVNEDRAGIDVINSFQASQVDVPALSMMVLYDEARVDGIATSIITDLDQVNLTSGEARHLNAYVVDQYGQVMLGEDYTYTIADPSIARANGSEITGLKDGSTTVVITSNNIETSIAIQVGDKIPTRIELVGEDSVYETRETTLVAKVYDQNNDLMTGSFNLEWSSSNEDNATVDGFGKVSGLVVGTTTIQVQLSTSLGLLDASKNIEILPYEGKLIQVHYHRSDETYGAVNAWTWNTGVTDGMAPATIVDGTAIINIEVSPEASTVGFLIRQMDNWDEGSKVGPESSDHNISFPEGVRVAKVFIEAGETDDRILYSQETLELSKGVATFRFQDHDLFINNNMEAPVSVTLTVNGEELVMEYNPLLEAYVVELSNLENGDYTYSITAIMPEGEPQVISGIFSYVVPVVSIDAEFADSTIGRGQNALLKLAVEANMPMDIASISLDLSSLGKSRAVSFDKDLMEQSFTIPYSMKNGKYNVGITLVDGFGNEHTDSIDIHVNGAKADMFDWDEARIYFVLTDRFANGDLTNDDPNGEAYDKTHPETYHGGDFAGLTSQLDYLEELGINTLWITPVVDNIDWDLREGSDGSQYGYHGYWAKTFTELDEHLGDMDDFKELVTKAHDKGIKIMLDIVVNHSGYGLKEGDSNTSNASNFPTNEDREVFDDMLRDEPVSGDTLKGELAGLPDFATEEALVSAKLVEWQAGWVSRLRDHGSSDDTIDFFRVDTVKHVEQSTWVELKNALVAIDPDFKMIGEYYGGNLNNTGGYLDDSMMDSILDFDFKYKAADFANGQINNTEDWLLWRNQEMQDGPVLGHFLSSHDEDGFLSHRIGGDVDKFLAAVSLQMTSIGQPVIYYGEELGQSGKNAGDMDQGEFSGNRDDMPWEDLTNNDTSILIHNHYKILLNIRDDYSLLFSRGDRHVITGGDDEGYTVFSRSYDDETLYVGINLGSGTSVEFDVDTKNKKQVIDLMTGRTYSVSNGKVTIDLPAAADGGTFILVAKESNSSSNSGSSNSNNNSGINIDNEELPEGIKINFKDISNHWAKEMIELLVSKGITKGTSKDLFSPNTQVTRGQFVTFINRSIDFGEVEGDTLTFTDVKEDDYYYEAVRVMYYLGLIDGESETEFGPDNPLTREQAVKILMSVYEHLNKSETAEEDLSGFADEEKIAKWARKAFRKSVALEFIEGKSNKVLDPKGIATRAEAAKLIIKLLESLNLM